MSQRCVGLKVYRANGEPVGTITERYISGWDDTEVFLINDDWEIAVSNTAHLLWTLAPDNRGEHVQLK